MGLDFLDTSFRIEKQFGVKLEPDDLLSVWAAQGNDCAVGDLHDIVVQKCRSLNLPVPRGSWNRIRLVLAESLGVQIHQIRRDTWLRKDLEFD